MFCKNCGSQLPDGMNFCQFCGTPQQSNTSAEYETYAAPQQPDTPVEYETYAAPPVMPPVPPVAPSEPPVAPPPPVNPINPGEPDKPKKNNTGNIIVAVVAVVLIVTVAVVAIILFGNKDKDQGDTTTTTATTQAEITIPANNTVADPSTSGTETTASSTEQSSSLPITLPSLTIPSFAPSMPSIQLPTTPPTQAPTTPPTRPTTPPTQAPTTPSPRPTTPPTQAPTAPPTQPPTAPPTQPSVSRPSLSSAESVAKSYAKDAVLLDFSSLIDKEILGMSKISPEIDKYVVSVTGESSASKAYATISTMFGTKVNNARDFLDIIRLVSGYEDELKAEFGSDYRITTTVHDSAYLSASEAAPYVSAAKSQINSVVSSSGINWNAIEDYAAVNVSSKVSGSKSQDELYMTVILAYINGSWKVLCINDGYDNILFGPMIIESFTEA